MARYIDADAFVKNMSEIKESTLQNHFLKRGNEPIDGFDADFLRAIVLAKQLVDEFPATEVRPNVRGKWEEKDGYDGDVYYDCSACGNSWTTIEGTPWDNGMNFCPNCGADMRGEEHE